MPRDFPKDCLMLFLFVYLSESSILTKDASFLEKGVLLGSVFLTFQLAFKEPFLESQNVGPYRPKSR